MKSLALNGMRLVTVLVVLASNGGVEGLRTPQPPSPQGTYFGQERPGSTPEVFAPGIISDGRPAASIAFTPDGREVYFAKDTPDLPDLNVIMYMRREVGHWVGPRVAPFSGRYRDWNLNLSPDGSRLYFTSRRPLEGGDEPKKDNDLWYVERTTTGWAKPRNLGHPVNTEKMDCYPSVTRTGTLYFHGFDYADGRGGADIYCAELKNGRYETPVNVGGAINSSQHDWDAFIAPDESHLIFASVNRTDSVGGGDLYVSFRRNDGSWTSAKNLGEPINSRWDEICPSLSPDGRYLFFTSNRRGSQDVYWVDAGIIGSLMPSGVNHR